jgi:hypothetical protein
MMKKLQGSTMLNSRTLARSPLHLSTLSPLQPWFVTGFADAESSFKLNIHKSKNVKIGWNVIPTFSIELHGKDKLLLEDINLILPQGPVLPEIKLEQY